MLGRNLSLQGSQQCKQQNQGEGQVCDSSCPCSFLAIICYRTGRDCREYQLVLDLRTGVGAQQLPLRVRYRVRGCARFFIFFIPRSPRLSFPSSMLYLGSGFVLLIDLPAPAPLPGDSQVSDRP